MEESTACYNSPIGFLEIKASPDFVTSISFLEDKTPPSIQHSTPPLIENCIQQLDEYFSGNRKIFELPIQQPGTDFQQKVWAELQKISFGETITYLELAKRLGDVKSIRAAGSANGKNNLAVIVPCHRVIGSNGKLVGYAGGIWRKKHLLLHEMKSAASLGLLF